MNLIRALSNLTKCKQFELGKNEEFVPNYVSAEGYPLEIFIKANPALIPERAAMREARGEAYSLGWTGESTLADWIMNLDSPQRLSCERERTRALRVAATPFLVLLECAKGEKLVGAVINVVWLKNLRTALAVFDKETNDE